MNLTITLGSGETLTGFSLDSSQAGNLRAGLEKIGSFSQPPPVLGVRTAWVAGMI